MKKRVLFISLALVLLLTALMPSAVTARSDARGRPVPAVGDFTGAGLIYVTYMPPPAIKGNIWRYAGELAEGFLQQSGWDLLAGASFWSSHDSFVVVKNDGGARGLMRGEFRLVRPDGTGVLEGVFDGVISGNLFTGFLSDSGMWFSTGGTGVFSGVRAWGRWSADLSYDPGLGTLVGPLSWEGKYMGSR